MRRSPHTIALLLLGTWLAGCAGSPWSAYHPTPAQPPAADGLAAMAQAASASPADTAAQQDRARQMQEVMTELQQLGAFDPASQARLMDDLRQTDPALWPGLVQQFRAAAAYRRRVANQEPGIAGDTVPAGFTEPVAAAPPGTGNTMNRLPTAADAAVAPLAAPAGDYPTTAVPAAPPRAANRPEASPVVPSAAADATTEDWRGQVAGAIRALEAEPPKSADAAEETARQAQLRMLYLLAGRRDDAVRPIAAIDPAQQEFWSKQFYGLATYLDVQRNPDAVRRAAETKQILTEAVGRLGEAAPLVVRNLAFCTEVQSYGCTKRFDKCEFLPDQEVLLYAEVDNFATESTPKGFHTALRSSYQLFDSQGQRVAEHSFTTTEEYCQNPRRDYFIGYHLRMPKRIYPGKHTLQLTIEDLKSKKVGQSTLEFTIKGEPGA